MYNYLHYTDKNTGTRKPYVVPLGGKLKYSHCVEVEGSNVILCVIRGSNTQAQSFYFETRQSSTQRCFTLLPDLK